MKKKKPYGVPDGTGPHGRGLGPGGGRGDGSGMRNTGAERQTLLDSQYRAWLKRRKRT